MEAFVALCAVLANLVTVARLLVYRRGCARYRFGMSLLAYLMIVCAGGQAIDVLVNGAHVTPWQAGFSMVIAALVLRARGNVAYLVRCV